MRKNEGQNEFSERVRAELRDHQCSEGFAEMIARHSKRERGTSYSPEIRMEPNSLSGRLRAFFGRFVSGRLDQDYIRAAEGDGHNMDERLFRLFFHAGANPNARDQRGRSAVHILAARGDSYGLCICHSHGARMDVTRPGLPPPLSLAAGNGHFDAVVKILEYGCYPAQKRKLLERDGWQIVARFCQEFKFPEHPINTLMRDTKRREAADITVKARRQKMLDQQDDAGWTAAHHAVAAGRRDIMILLRELGANMEAEALDPRTTEIVTPRSLYEARKKESEVPFPYLSCP